MTLEKNISATQLAINLLPKILKENSDSKLTFDEVFSFLIKENSNVFLDEVGDPRIGILRGIISRYQKGDLFLKNVLIEKNKNGILEFYYTYKNFFESKKMYLIYVNTIQFIENLNKNELTIDEYMNLDSSYQEYYTKLLAFKKDIENCILIK